MRRNRAQYFIYFNYSTTDNNIFSKDNLCKFRVTFSELFVAEEILKGKQTENCWDYLHKIQNGVNIACIEGVSIEDYLNVIYDDGKNNRPSDISA